MFFKDQISGIRSCSQGSDLVLGDSDQLFGIGFEFYRIGTVSQSSLRIRTGLGFSDRIGLAFTG